MDYQGLTDLTPATDREFITILTPCLQLVAPVGMTSDAQDTWFEAARKALADVPANLLRRGADHAMKHADHPAKIVPSIMREIAEDLEWRRKQARGAADIWAGASNSPYRDSLPAPGDERPTSDEVDAICKRFKVGRYANADVKQ